MSIENSIGLLLIVLAQLAASSSKTTQTDDFTMEEKLGFVMFECGLEGVAIKIVKKSQFEHNESPEKKDAATETENIGEKLAKENDTTADATSKKEELKKKDATTAGHDGGNVSSCVIELKVVWFNFAAPPRAPITRKIDYTRYDIQINIY